MPTTPALRFRHEHTIPLDNLSFTDNFTIEAWVCPAYMDSSARLYPEPCYDGPFVRLKPGLYRNIKDQHLSKLGSVCLPEYVEGVFFTEPDFKGEALALRDDLSEVPEMHGAIGSALILDRSHDRQNHVVLFEQPNFKGKAHVLVLLDVWRAPVPTATNGTGVEGLTQVGSVWAPPGTVLEIHHAYGFSMMHGDMGNLPEGVTSVQARREAPMGGREMVYTLADDDLYTALKTPPTYWGPNSGNADLPNFRTVAVPQGFALVLFENAYFGGRHDIITGSRDDLGNLPFKPCSGAFLETPDGVSGMLLLKPEVKIVPQGATLPSDMRCAGLPGYYLEQNSGKRQTILGTMETNNNPGITVVRYAGILTNENGYGITLERLPGVLKGAPDELRFGGELLRTDRWYHLAQTWDGQTLRWILDGREVKNSAVPTFAFRPLGWDLGQGFRGSIARLRVWDEALSVEKIRDQRYPDVEIGREDNSLKPKDLPDITSYAQAPDAFVVTAELPSSPANTGLVQGIQHQVEAEHQQNMQTAQQTALVQTTEAEKRAQQTLARAREQARRQVHFEGIETMGFVRGNTILEGNPKSGQFDVVFSEPNQTRVMDAVVDGQGKFFSIVDGKADGNSSEVKTRMGLGFSLNPNQSNPARALAVDTSARFLPTDLSPDNYIGMYWVLADGTFYRSWNTEGGFLRYGDMELFKAPTGPTTAWDMALDTERQMLFWTNGRELYSSEVDTDAPTYGILLPHAASFAPVAVAVAPDGSLLWLDAEAEMVRMLPFDQTKNSFGKIKDLYPAPKPTRGLAVCSLSNNTPSEGEAAFVYWVAKERRTLELPILDTPGRYIDFSYTKVSKPKHQTPVANTIINAIWANTGMVMPFIEELDTNYGPFSLENGFVIEAGIIGKFNQHIIDILSLDFDKQIILQNKGIKINTFFKDYETGSLISDEWFDIKIEVSKEKDNIRVTAYKNDQVLINYLSEKDEFYAINECRFHFPSFIRSRIPEGDVTFNLETARAMSGFISQVVVTDLIDPEKILAKRDRLENTGQVTFNVQGTGMVTVEQQGTGHLVVDTPEVASSFKVLKFRNPEDIVLFEPVFLNLDQGWTVSAEILWDGPLAGSTSPVGIYELGTFENEDRLVCSIDAYGMPLVYVRWDGINVNDHSSCFDTGQRVPVDALCKITWTATSSGLLSAYINDDLVWKAQLGWPGGTKVFETHQLGAPCTEQTHKILWGALYNNPYDPHIEFDPFRGSIHTFTAWNIYVPNAINDQSNTPRVDSSWARSVLTVESNRRYLHAGRLDGQEPAVTLFPMDMDCGLFIKTSLDQAHASLTQAHNQQVAADAYALHLKTDALQNAHNQLEKAQQTLSTTQVKTAADKVLAQEKANADKAAGRQQKANADEKARSDRSAGSDLADSIRNSGKQQAESQELSASEDKKKKISDANRRLSEHQDALDAKNQEYQDSRR